MNVISSRSLCALLLLATLTLKSGAADAASVSVVGEIFLAKRTLVLPLLKAVPAEPKKAMMSPFVPVDAKVLYDTLDKKAKGFNSGITLTKTPELKIASGKKELAKDKDVTIEADAVIGADEKIATNCIVKIGPKMAIGMVNASAGESVFLGTTDGATADTIRIVYLRFAK
jgi:hypothetical protein